MTISQMEMGGEDHLFLDVEDGKLASPCVVHHGLLLPEERQLCESVYQRSDGATVMAATSTVSQGMNFPSELVIIAEDSRFDEAKDRREVLQAQELLNAAGRAGRAGQNANGIVLVIPGKVVGIDIEDAKIGNHWSKLQSVFGQSDQCLDIDDPLTAILDRVHANTADKIEVDRYAITRLASVGLEHSVNKSLSAFRARKAGQGKWVEDRIAAAIAYQAKEQPESEEDLVEHQVASTLGISLPVMDRLSTALERTDDHHTVADWRRWFFRWIGDNDDLFDQIFRRETIDDLFGKPVTDREDSADRCKTALPYLKKLTKLWMQGKPLSDLELGWICPQTNLRLASVPESSSSASFRSCHISSACLRFCDNVRVPTMASQLLSVQRLRSSVPAYVAAITVTIRQRSAIAYALKSCLGDNCTPDSKSSSHT